MRISFYAPLKAPDHAVPSGDRRVARLLIAALQRAGHEVAIASRFRSLDGAGDPAVQVRLAEEGAAEARRLIADLGAGPPDLWLTYHCYYKAPDHLGPAVTRALKIPYVIHEPSYAPKRETGAWAAGHAASKAAIQAADLLLCATHLDIAWVSKIADPARIHHLPPFLDTAPFEAVDRAAARAAIAEALNLPVGTPWLLAVGMMRARDKLESYRRLGAALARLRRRDWRLIVVGDGAARSDVEAALAPFADRIVYAGALSLPDLARHYAAADLLVWPAAGEAYGMAFLEAAASGLPAVAGRVRGVPEVVIDGRTGLLVPEDDPAAFAEAVDRLMDDPRLRAGLGAGARAFAVGERGLAPAAARLDAELGALTRRSA